MQKAILFPPIQSAEDWRDFFPPGAPFAVVFVVNINLETRGSGKEIRRFAGSQVHRIGSTGVSFGKTLCYTGIALVFAEISRDILLVPLFQQAGSQSLAQIGVRALQVRSQKFRNGAVPGIPAQQAFKVLPALDAEDGIGKRRVAELDVGNTDVGDLKGLIVQIYRVAHLVGK